jgi:uncharacterized protein (TIGR02266 family)
MSVKTILIAHRSLAVRDRFAAALADAQQDYLLAGAEPALRAALANDRAPVSLALIDLSLAGERDPVAFVNDLRNAGPRPFPVVVFAGSVASAEQLTNLGGAGVAGYLNEHADAPQILPALAPHLFPDSFNRRASQRAPVAVPVSFRAGQTIAAAHTRDIGRGGIGIQTMDPLPTGTPLNFTVKLPGTGFEISASGRVIWADRRIGMGLQFDKLPADAQGQLDEYVRSAGFQ